jgi:ribonuclease HI
MHKGKNTQGHNKKSGRRVAGVGGYRGAPRNDKPSSPTADGTRPPLDAPSPEIHLYVDGGSRGNPGPAAYAVIAKDSSGTVLKSFSESIGQSTNNVAEYRALIGALELARSQGCHRVRVLSDSQLLVCQIRGTYRVKSPDLRILRYKADQIIAQFEAFSIVQVPRAELREVDRLVVRALDDSEVVALGQGKETREALR